MKETVKEKNYRFDDNIFKLLYFQRIINKINKWQAKKKIFNMMTEKGLIIFIYKDW